MRKTTSDSVSVADSTASPPPEHPRDALRFHPEAEEALHRLPFVGWHHGEIKFWDVPSTGGYVGGNLTGDALARIFLETLRQQSDAATPGAWLGWIVMGWMHHVFDMVGIKPDLDPESPINSLRGQVVGFSAVLSDVLREALKNSNLSLPPLDEEECLKQANEGLETRTAKPAIIRVAGARSGRRQSRGSKPSND
ncbi:MAG: hypothetical protein JSR64_11470 [Nitrospira sp.]|nr:hypothetical protein [Nitrospira sp.]